MFGFGSSPTTTDTEREVSLEDVQHASQTLQAACDARSVIRQHKTRMDIQYPKSQAAMYDAADKVRRLKRELSAVLGGETEADLLTATTTKAALDAAQGVLKDRRAELSMILHDGEAAFQKKMKDADAAVLAAYTQVTTVAKDYFKHAFSQRAMFANGNESEREWRMAILCLLCNKLLMGTVHENLRTLHCFLSGRPFSVIPLRGYRHVRTLKPDLEGKVTREPLMFPKGSRIDIPHQLPYREAWQEMILENRIALAED